MNQLSSQQKKLLYLSLLVVLLIPIVALGRPADRTEGSGGALAQLRKSADLGESDIGDIDPSSAAMNLVLLGMRGVATSVLWQQMDHFREIKDWGQMRATTQSIIRLQPHFIEVWRHNGWNLAFNVSAEWDDLRDRFYWVKEGGKFLKMGLDQNRRSPELGWEVGRICGFKIGMSDERKYFRKFFKVDPDPKFKGSADPELNEQGVDNYLVAKEWFIKACELERNRRQHIMDRTLFRASPARAQLDYASALQKDGVFGEITRLAWQDAFDDWTKKFGSEHFRVPELPTLDLWMEMTEEDIRTIAKTIDEENALKRWVDQYQNISSYRYWRARALFEAEPETAEAHRNFFEATEAYKVQDTESAKSKVEASIAGFGRMMLQYPEIVLNDDLVSEEVLTAILLREYVYRLNGEKPSEDFPLAEFWRTNQNKMPEIARRFDKSLIQ